MRPWSWLNSKSNAIYHWKKMDNTEAPKNGSLLTTKQRKLIIRAIRQGQRIQFRFCYPWNNCNKGDKCNATGANPTSITPLHPAPPCPAHMLEASHEVVEQSLKFTPYLPSHPPVANILQSFRILTEAIPGFLSSICLSTDKVYYNGKWRQTVPK